MSDHEWIEVGDRRWCLGCSLFQQRAGTAFPTPRTHCPRDTPYAKPKWGDNEERRERDLINYRDRS
jgi:hypothetical protein